MPSKPAAAAKDPARSAAGKKAWITRRRREAHRESARLSRLRKKKEKQEQREREAQEEAGRDQQEEEKEEQKEREQEQEQQVKGKGKDKEQEQEQQEEVKGKGKEKEKEKENAAEQKQPEESAPEVNLDHEIAKLEIEMGGSKEHLNILFMGHVDAGKSTTGGQILVLTGMVDRRTLEKYEKEAKEKGRESWVFSWALDTNPEERDKGKTVEVGRASFETETKKYTILDAPGHKSFVPNMIGGAAQADVAILIISARKGEFEAGFDRQGQTREHAMLAKTAGVKKLIVAVNKMDDPTVNWAEERYTEITEKLKPFLKQLGFNIKSDVEFMPISGFTGLNLKDPLEPGICPWYSGPSLLQFLDRMEKIQRNDDQPLRMPISVKFKDMGTNVGGKLESGVVKMNQQIVIMPNNTKADVIAIEVDDEPAQYARSGDNVLLKLRGVEEEEISTGFVLCHPQAPVKTTKIFDAQLMILDYKNIMCAGYTAVMHIHTLIEEVQIAELRHLIDKKTGRKSKQPPKFVKQGQVCIARIECQGLVCIETYNEYPQLGRFTIRDEGKTIAMGKVLKLIQA